MLAADRIGKVLRVQMIRQICEIPRYVEKEYSDEVIKPKRKDSTCSLSCELHSSDDRSLTNYPHQEYTMLYNNRAQAVCYPSYEGKQHFDVKR